MGFLGVYPKKPIRFFGYIPGCLNPGIGQNLDKRQMSLGIVWGKSCCDKQFIVVNFVFVSTPVLLV